MPFSQRSRNPARLRLIIWPQVFVMATGAFGARGFSYARLEAIASGEGLPRVLASASVAFA
jgi:hypothetical protein